VGLFLYPLSLLGKRSVNTFPPQRRNVQGVVFNAVSVVSKASRRLNLPRTSLLKNDNFNLLQQRNFSKQRNFKGTPAL
jgi:hypothetical protein